MNNMRIKLHSKAMPVRGIEVDELERVCQENSIEFTNSAERLDGIQHSALWSWVTLYFSAPMIEAIVAGLISAAAYDLLKKAVKRVVNTVREKYSVANKSKETSEIELQSPSVILKIESDQVSDETLDKAIDAFVKVSESTANKEGIPVIPTFVVIDGDIKILSQNEYITQYIISKKDEAEDKQCQ